jgi:hypothetical protein
MFVFQVIAGVVLVVDLRRRLSGETQRERDRATGR